MTLHRAMRAALFGGLIVSLAGCGGGFGLFGRRSAADQSTPEAAAQLAAQKSTVRGRRTGTIFDLFANAADPNVTVEVNKYIWNATLEVLNFLPVESVDPFTGVLVMGYGVPPGGGQAYRATVYVQDPSLDARALKVSLQTRGGAPVSRETARAVEDAILTRARQLRVRDSRL